MGVESVEARRPHLPIAHEPRVAELAEVGGDPRLPKLSHPHELGHRHLLVGEQVHEADPGRIAEQLHQVGGGLQRGHRALRRKFIRPSG